MRLLRVLIGVLLIACLGWTATQSEESIGNLKFKLPKGWTKTVYRNEVSLRPGEVKPSEWCQVTIKSSLQAKGDLVQWVNKQAEEFIGRREVLMNTPIPYQDDPKGWEGCGLSFAVRVNANTPTYYHMFIGFRRGDVAGTMHFVTDRLDYTQKYQEAIGVISSSMQPLNGFGGGAPPPTSPAAPLTNPTAPLTNPVKPPTNPLSVPSEPVSPANISLTLPIPAAMPAGTPEVAANSLAKRILLGGQDGLAALERAALASGFAIHDIETRNVLQTPSSTDANGLSFGDIDLIGANLSSTPAPASVTTADLEQAFRGVKAFEKVDFQRLWRDTVAQAKESPKARDQFFGHLLTALGTHSGGRFTDFRAPSPTGLSAVQVYFLCWNSAGHIRSFIAKRKEEADSLPARGPSVRMQSGASDAVADLMNVVESYSKVNWSEAINELSNLEYLDPTLYILAIARAQLLLHSIYAYGELDEGKRPLVREKKLDATGEQRNLNIVTRIEEKSVFKSKFERALRACGYSLPNGLYGDVKLKVELDLDDKKVRVVEGSSSFQTPRIGGETTTHFPIEGAPQTRKLSANPQEERATAIALATVRLGLGDPKVDTLEYAQANAVAWNNQIKSNFMPPAKQVYVQIPIKDWLAEGWTGRFGIELHGSGSYKQGNENGQFDTRRFFVLDATLDRKMPGGALSGEIGQKARDGGWYTAAPRAGIVPETYYMEKVKETYYAASCLSSNKVLQSDVLDIQKREPTERERILSSIFLEIHPKEDVYLVNVRRYEPQIPVSFYSKTGKTVQQSKPILSLFYNTHQSNSKLFGERQNDTGELTNGGTVAMGLIPLEVLYLGFRSKKAGTFYLKGQIAWEFQNGGSFSMPLLARLADRGTVGWRILYMAELELKKLEEARPFVQDMTDLDTCYETEVPTIGQLGHAGKGGQTKPPTDRSRQARYRSTR